LWGGFKGMRSGKMTKIVGLIKIRVIILCSLFLFEDYFLLF